MSDSIHHKRARLQTVPQGVYQVNGGSDLVVDHLVGMRPGNVIANAFRAWFAQLTQTQARAGYFKGRVDVVGDLTVLNGNKPFKIDHPLDPQNRYLLHKLSNTRRGSTSTTALRSLMRMGTASVELPEWFEAQNENFCYQLTAVGAAAPALHVAKEIYGNTLKIAGGEGG
jgi:hypothetical protein